MTVAGHVPLPDPSVEGRAGGGRTVSVIEIRSELLSVAAKVEATVLVVVVANAVTELRCAATDTTAIAAAAKVACNVKCILT